MNVYSIVPSTLQATVSVRISKMIPRIGQMNAPTSKIVVTRLTSILRPRRDALRDEDDRERVRDRPEKNAMSHQM